jgi:hypothetical protein
MAGVSFMMEAEVFLSTITTRPALGPTNLLSNGYFHYFILRSSLVKISARKFRFFMSASKETLHPL